MSVMTDGRSDVCSFPAVGMPASPLTNGGGGGPYLVHATGYIRS
jgi:hypothetical protein